MIHDHQDRPAPGDLFTALADTASRWPGAPYLVVDGGETLSYRDVVERSERLARFLWQAGVCPGDRIALAAENGPEWAIIAFGAARIGAVLAPLNTRLVRREARHLLQLVDPRAVFLQRVVRGRDLAEMWAPPGDPGLLPHAAATVVLVGDSAPLPGATPWNAVLEPTDGLPLPPTDTLIAQTQGSHDPELAGAAVMIGTSGTTGLPKCAVLGHASLLSTATAVAERQGLRPGRRLLSVSPFFHASGYLHGLLACLVSGATLVTAARYQPERLEALVTAGGVDVYHGALLPETARRRSGSPLAVWCAGTEPELRRAESLGGNLFHGIYGMTETTGCSAIVAAGHHQGTRHATNGSLLPGVEARIVDLATGEDVPTTGSGEILIRGTNLMLGYFRDPEATAAVVDSDGWLHTGDLGHLRGDGVLVWQCRLKDVLRVGGENVTATEIEHVLREHADIEDAAVVATPDDRLGEVPVAAVVAAARRTPSEEELRSHCRDRLADFKVPRAIRFLAELPRTPTQKVRKSELRSLFDTESR